LDSLGGKAVLKRFQLVALVAAVAVAALLPLYGDPRNSAVTHAEWARMLLRGLDMQEAIQQTTTATQAFAILSWKGSLSFRADRFIAGEDVRVDGEGERRQVVATGEIGEVTYAVAVVRGGDYRLRVQLAGNPQRPVSAEMARAGEVKPLDAFTITPAVAMTWIDAGATHLDPGAYTASVLLPRGTTLEHVEVAPPCVMPIEPPGGWKAPAVLLSEHAAVTMVQALDKQSELPPSDAPFELEASQFHVESGAPTFAAAGTLQESIKGGPGGTRAVVIVDLPEAGLYTISAFGLKGAGQSWTADSCLKSIVCADKDTGADVAQWRPVLTAQFAPGHHSFSVLLAPGALIQRVRAERKKDSPADYVTTLRRLGFDVGPPGPMPRNRAVDAMRFLEKKAVTMKEALCGDLVLPTIVPVTRAGLEVAQIPGPGQPPPFAGPGQPPFGSGPLVPTGGPTGPPVALPSPSPIVTPAPSPTPSVPAASPPAPPSSPAPLTSPTPLPPPPTLPSPDVTTPVLPVPSPSP
jgi:hypothetical protein